jgi:hypothetical protein
MSGLRNTQVAIDEKPKHAVKFESDDSITEGDNIPPPPLAEVRDAGPPPNGGLVAWLQYDILSLLFPVLANTSLPKNELN